MKVIIYGASGMVGQGVLRECLSHPEVESILVVGRTPCGLEGSKLKELLPEDMYDVEAYAQELQGYDACFYTLGVSDAGMSKEKYTRITHTLTLSVAEVLVRLNSQMTFCYVSGEGTDASEKGRSMWARVKGKTENDLLAQAFKAAYMFRAGYIQPMDGIKSKTPLYRLFYAVGAPLYPLWKTLAPNHVTTTRAMGQAMIRIVQEGHPEPLVFNRDINTLAAASTAS